MAYTEPTPLPATPRPTTKEEGKSLKADIRDQLHARALELIDSGQDVKIDSKGVISVRPKLERPAGISEETWQKGLAAGAFESETDYVIDPVSQRLALEMEYIGDLASELSGSGGAAGAAVRSALSIEGDKQDEITRQMKDFAYRADLTYDLMDAEQQYGFNATDHNISSWKAQRDLGLATMPGGFAGQPSMAQSLSSIIRPSNPSYVRPDYRLNQVVGLPGAQGFDDPDYDEYGMPRFAQGTSQMLEFVPVRPMPIVSWPWKPRGN